MASVIRNPIILHCLDQFGITPAEARAAESTPPSADEGRNTEYAAFIAKLPEILWRQAPRTDGVK